jgi:uncharacterized protein YutE (UPF0331/DUF86 family)
MKEAIDRAVFDEPLSKAMQRAVGMRNLLAHDYADIDWTLVVKVLRDDLEDLANFGRVMIAWMNGQQGWRSLWRRTLLGSDAATRLQ